MAQQKFNVKNGLSVGGLDILDSSGNLSIPGTITIQGVSAATVDYVNSATTEYVDTALANLVDGAPALLNTLNEISAAIGDDPNFVTTVNNSIDLKLNSADFDSTADTWIISKSTDDVSEGAINLYYTDARVHSALSASDGITYNSSTGEFTLTDTGVTAGTYGSASLVPVLSINANGQVTSASTVSVAGVSNFSYTSATNTFTIDTADGGSFSASGDLTSFDTGDLTEGSGNLYYTDARARAALSASDGITYNSSTGAFTLTDTGVTAGTYGSASAVPVITVNANGQITSVSNTAVAGVSNVTYDGSTGVLTVATSSGSNYDVDLGVGTADSPDFASVSANYIDLDTTSGVPSQVEGRIYYNDEYKALTVYNDITGSSLQVGLEEWIRVYNNTGSTIPNGTPLYVTGAVGEVPTVAPADATTLEKARVIAVATHDIANASEGVGTVRGLISGIDTSGLTAGQPVHVAPNGSFQTSAPTYPYFPTDVGACIVSDATNGYIYVRIREHSLEQFRVTGNTHMDGSLTVEGNLLVQGTQTITSQANLAITNSFVYLNSGDTIGIENTTFVGTGLNDGYFNNQFEGSTTTTYYVRIDGVGTGTGGVDTYEWSKDNFVTTEATGVDLEIETLLDNNICFHVNATTGHTLGDVWYGTASPVLVDTGWATNRNTGTSGVGYTHMGVFYDVSDDKFKFFDEYDPEPSGTIDTGDASFSLGTVQASLFEGDLTGNVTGNLIGNASTASSAAKWTTARTITLDGDLTGNVSIDGSGDVTLTATVAANSVALGTDTTGNYMVDVAAGGGISVSHTQGESSTATVSHADTSSVANLSSDNTNGVVIQDVALTFDTYGHVQTATVATIDLDGRYYTETEADSRFVNVTGDTITSGTSIGLTINHDIFGQGLVLHRNDSANAASIVFKNNAGQAGILYAQATGDLTWRNLDTTNSFKIWHEGNDGASSGLDADLLDGQQGAYYLDYNNFTNVPTNISTFVNDSGYLTSQISHADVVVDGDFTSQGIMLRGATSGTYSILTDNSTNWNTAYSWGNHASAGYLTSYTDTNTTYDISAGTAAGGANLNLNAGGSGSGTDSVKFASGTNVTVSYTDANTITISSTDTNTTYSAGTGLSLSGTTFNHSNSVTAGTVSEGGTARTLTYGGTFNVPSVTYDAQGHITGTTTVALTLPASDNTDTTYSAGTGLSLSGTTFNHTNSVTAGTASEGGATRTLAFGGTFNVPSVTYDAQGHVTSKGSVTLTLPANPNTNTTYSHSAVTTTGGAFLRLTGSDSTNDDVKLASGTNVTVSYTDANTITISSTDTNTTYSAGNGISLSGTTFSVAAGSGLTQEASGLAHADTSTQSSVDNSGSTVIQDVTLDGYGHVTGLSSKTLSYTDVGAAAASHVHDYLPLSGGDMTGGIYLGDFTVSTDNSASDAIIGMWSTGRAAVQLGGSASNPTFEVISKEGNVLLSVVNGGQLTLSQNIVSTGLNSSSDPTYYVYPALASNLKSVTIDGGTAWHSLNDGSGSGLDADLLDGVQSTSFLRSDADDTATGHIIFDNDTGIRVDYATDSIWYKGYGIESNRDATYIRPTVDNTKNLYIGGTDSSLDWLSVQIRTGSSTGLTHNGNTVWSAGNDGSGSGLDADLLDGQQGSYYYAASNPNGYQTAAQVSAAISSLVDSAPTTLDTLNELAAALGDDPNFATTVTNSIATKLSLTGGTLSNGDNVTLEMRPNDAGQAYLKVGRSLNGSQGTGIIEVTQDGAHGGGFYYNGDGTPAFISGEASDTITFYRMNAGVKSRVFQYGYSSDTVAFVATPTAAGSTMWHAGNDGSGSGLDADLLDGQHGSYYYSAGNPPPYPAEADTLATVTARGATTSTQSTFSGGIVASGGITGLTLANGISGTNFNITGVNQLEIADPGEGIVWKAGASGDILLAVVDDSTDNILNLSGTGAELNVRNNLVWHAGNDGSGSGLDADLLDGQHASDFAASSHTHSYLPLSGGTMSGVINMSGTQKITTAGFAGIEYWNNSTWQVYVGTESNTAGARYNSRNGVHTWYNNSAQTMQLSGNDLTIVGALNATSKSFLIDHPTKPGMKLRYGSLEGPENGVYVRGRLKGTNTIELPEYWTKLVDPDSITVQLTSMGRFQKLYVKEIADNKVVIGNGSWFSNNTDCFYIVHAERVDVDKLEVEIY